jgi:hypothetical protein
LKASIIKCFILIVTTGPLSFGSHCSTVSWRSFWREGSKLSLCLCRNSMIFDWLTNPTISFSE